MTDPITETDLHAFVDGQLHGARRIEVEDHLARHPDIAARVMADLRTRDALGLAFGGPPSGRPSPAVIEAARRLERGLVWRRVALRLQRAAAVAVLVGAGWFAHAQTTLFEIADSEAAPTRPAFVDDARHAHKTALVRARMASQREQAVFDPAEILSETGIAVPQLPGDWRVFDAQVFPSSFGHSVELALDAAALGRVSLFVARAPSSTIITPSVARIGNDVTTYWQSGTQVYALTGSAPEAALAKAAARLHAGLH